MSSARRNNVPFARSRSRRSVSPFPRPSIPNQLVSLCLQKPRFHRSRVSDLLLAEVIFQFRALISPFYCLDAQKVGEGKRKLGF
ncbi:hypothetical protein ACFX13_017359 [Malus domestica]